MIDRYTKFVLSVIAVCLLVLVGRGFVKPALAQMRASGFSCDVTPYQAGGQASYSVSCTFR